MFGSRVRQRVRTSRPREIVEAQPEHHGAARAAGEPHPAGDAVDEADQRDIDVFERSRRAAECALRSDRAAAAARPHRSRVVVVGERVELPPGGPAEQRHEHVLGETRDLADGRDADVVQPPSRHRPDSPEPLDRERMEKRELPARRHDEQPVRLGDPAGHLREELRPRDPDGDRQPDPLAHLGPEPHRDLARAAGATREPADVEKRLVDREPFDERRRVLEDPIDVPAGLCVGGHARLDDDRSRAEAPGEPDAHRRVDAVGLRLVARSEDHPAADEHGPAAQVRTIALLHRREERVDVGVENRRLAGHDPVASVNGSTVSSGGGRRMKPSRSSRSSACSGVSVLAGSAGRRQSAKPASTSTRAPAARRQRADRADLAAADEERLPPPGLDRRCDQAALELAQLLEPAQALDHLLERLEPVAQPRRLLVAEALGQVGEPLPQARQRAAVEQSLAFLRGAQRERARRQRRLAGGWRSGPSSVGCLGDDEAPRRGAAGRRRAPSGGCASSPAG